MQQSVPKSKRSILVTLLACVTMAGSALLLPVTVISLLMVLAGGYGTKTADMGGILAIYVAPPLTLLAGLGLLLRWRWARYWMFLLLAVLIAVNIKSLAAGGKTTTYHTDASGVVTASESVWGGPNLHSVPIIAFCTASIVVLLLPSVRREFRPVVKSNPAPVAGPDPVPPPLPGREWRVGHRGRDMMYYEEFRDGAWQRLDIDGEMLTGRAHHVIFFAGPDAWHSHPEWARHRRAEIIARIKGEFRPPDYEYHGGEATGGEGPLPPPIPAIPPPSTSPAVSAVPAAGAGKKSGGWRGAIVGLICLIGFSGWMGWLVHDGFERGVVRDVFKHSRTRTPPSRAEEPFQFWMLITFYSVGAAGTAGLALVVAWHVVFPWRPPQT
ncbi:MAG: hypothetical protein IAE97_04910 [Chthoniobacterales bacterium]|nr:hypothetical protein [Chthoniobacterales bacterium]